ncbi:MAG: hypothetical protein K1X55_04735 [Chitinophagales bacterium]|nr:hypothetical protein [Chitinophagales bacterium]
MNRFFKINILQATFLLVCSLAKAGEGPVAPEVQTFTPVSASELVDPFTGDFKYNIPLFELPGPDGGYPFNLFYNSGISMSQEASWVGLGWNLNPGAITRQLRNIPDEFNGIDKVRYFKTMENSFTVGGSFGIDAELAGFDDVDGNVSVDVSYNNLTGLGLSIGGGFSVGVKDGGFTGGLQLNSGNLSGLGANPTIGFSKINKEAELTRKNNSYTLGLNLNSLTGLQGISFGFSTNDESRSVTAISKDGNARYTKWETTDGNSGGISMRINRNYYSPTIQDELTGGSVGITVKLGAEAWPLTANVDFSGYFSIQKLKYKNQWVEKPAFGYNNLDKNFETDAQGNLHWKGGLMDISHTHEQLMTKHIPILPNPVPTYDIYSINAQGFNASFRSKRTDIGYYCDEQMHSGLADVDASLEFGAGTGIKLGGEFSASGSFTDSELWLPGTNEADFPRFRDKSALTNSYQEPVYYQLSSNVNMMKATDFEALYDNGSAAAVELSGHWLTTKPSNKLAPMTGNSKTFSLSNSILPQRVERTQVVQSYTNEEILGAGVNDKLLQEFDIKYYATGSLSNFENLSNYAAFNRNNLPKHHPGGYVVTREDGARFVFALPVYVKEQKDVSFSTYGCDDENNSGLKCPYTCEIPLKSGANPNDVTQIDVDGKGPKILEVTEIPQYAVSFLITSILGADYVDVKNDGLTDDDLGYWVKFEYAKTTDNFKWKAPFAGANFIQGQEALTADNMGVYSCGTREQWYLVSAQTKTHIAEFQLTQRVDGRGAANYTQNTNLHGAYSYKLDDITLYTKQERIDANGDINPDAIPIQHITLNYATTVGEELCKGVETAPSGRGKLTLAGIEMSFRNNTRGTNNKYDFLYNVNNADDNPDYDAHAMDRWGIYQKDVANDRMQTNYYNPYTKSTDIDKRVAAWSLKKIILPSGAIMAVNYEADSYGFVQNKPAAVMYPIANYYSSSNDHYVEIELPSLPTKSLPSNPTNQDKLNYIKALMNGQDYLYFSLYVNLNEPTIPGVSGIGDFEQVSGYCGINQMDIDPTTGKLRIKLDNEFTQAVIKNDYHPFNAAGYNYIKGNRMDLHTSPFNNPNEIEQTTGVEKLEAIMSVITNLAEFYKLFTRVEAECALKNFASEIDVTKSFIRLPQFEGEKYGGGLRVNQITIQEKDDPNADTYGTVYDYSITEDIDKSGFSITHTSGVAENEPEIGKDENAINSFVKWPNQIVVFSSAPQFSELPINDGFYPPANVGYRKVTTRSLATDDVLENSKLTNPDPIIEQIRTTGQTVQEFYTAKEFPVRTNYTPLERGKNLFSSMLPPLPTPIVSLSYNYLYASQGLSIELNDMHGKPKKVSSYGQDDKGKILPSAYAEQEYIYQAKAVEDVYAGKIEQYGTFDNHVTTMCNEGVQNTDKLMGVDVEEFIDIRKVHSETYDLGVAVNADISLIIIPIALPTAYPKIGYETEDLGTMVTNKVIMRSGLLKEVTAKENGAMVVTRNEAYDELTGQPVLVSTTKTLAATSSNDEKTYKYDILGHWVYEGMDGAYKNMQHEVLPKIDASGARTSPTTVTLNDIPLNYKAIKFDNYTTTELDELLANYYQGDELMVCPYIGTGKDYTIDYTKAVKAIVVSVEKDMLIVEPINGNLPSNDFYIKVMRPGRRNIVGAPISTFVTTTNPLISRTVLNPPCNPNE